MEWYAMSDRAIQKEIGKRFRQLRLNRNVTQKDLADRTMTSVTRIKSLEGGNAKLETMIMVLRELDILEDLDFFIADPGISPLELAKRQGSKRQRASNRDDGLAEGEDSEW
jgi:transcriptional regulator with XRE-family HTH domain